MTEPAILNEFTLNHHHFSHTLTEAQTFLHAARAGDILFIEGPTKVGRQTLIRRLFKEEVLPLRAEMEQNQELMPIVVLQAPPMIQPETYLRDLLNRLTEELIPETNEDKQRVMFGGYEILDDSASNDKRRRRVEILLQARGTRTLIIYNAHYLTPQISTRNRQYRSMLDILQALAEFGNTRLVLVGNYGTFDADRISTSVLSRSSVIELPAYRVAESEEAAGHWSDAVHALAGMLPPAFQREVLKCEGLVLDGSLGCVGLLVEWLRRAYLLKQRSSSDTSFVACLEKTQYSYNQLLALSNDLYKEPSWEQNPRKLLRRKLGIVKTSESPKQKRRPGQRNPMRDPVGGPAA